MYKNRLRTIDGFTHRSEDRFVVLIDGHKINVKKEFI